MSRNRVSPETAEWNRSKGRPGGYTFNAPIEPNVSGVGFTVACVRLGDHAHLDIDSGEIIRDTPSARVNRGKAGHLVLRWHEWEVLREILAASERIHVAEVEQPTDDQLRYHIPAPRVSTPQPEDDEK